jgi:hypothetical protein
MPRSGSGCKRSQRVCEVSEIVLLITARWTLKFLTHRAISCLYSPFLDGMPFLKENLGDSSLCLPGKNWTQLTLKNLLSVKYCAKTFYIHYLIISSQHLLKNVSLCHIQVYQFMRKFLYNCEMTVEKPPFR